ncbi:radical SAM protein [Candidatus Saganbacteria bacterium]|nr:radical SAM protein [Candidatus Saganbacteria bacterium]
MIDINKLFCGKETDSDALRYGQGLVAAKTAAERRPVVVWNTTRSCNFRCRHCYTDSENKKYPGELTTEEGRNLIADLAAFKIPALLLSGGEPLVRPDLLALAQYAKNLGIRPTLSTNGSLIDEKMAEKVKQAGFTYVGISLDGLEKVNDEFRGVEGAFQRALAAFRNCRAVEQKVGLRLTLTKHTVADLQRIFDLIEKEGINRVCFYHLVYSGRGGRLMADDLSNQETREALDIILARTQDFYNRGLGIDVLTVDNHADGIYLYLKLLKKDPERAAKVLELLKWNGGGRFSSGVGIADIDPAGNVHADQFWQHHTFGNVRERKFSDIWRDTSDPLMAGLKNRLPLLKGRCGHCRWQAACGGALRVRADLFYHDPWAEDPACYLTEEEIAPEN